MLEISYIKLLLKSDAKNLIVHSGEPEFTL